jgi:hypothetical protein
VVARFGGGTFNEDRESDLSAPMSTMSALVLLSLSADRRFGAVLLRDRPPLGLM